VPAVPLLATGKPDYQAVRALAEERMTGRAATAAGAGAAPGAS
jgi:hypothetical protein